MCCTAHVQASGNIGSALAMMPYDRCAVQVNLEPTWCKETNYTTTNGTRDCIDDDSKNPKVDFNSLFQLDETVRQMSNKLARQALARVKPVLMQDLLGHAQDLSNYELGRAGSGVREIVADIAPNNPKMEHLRVNVPLGHIHSLATLHKIPLYLAVTKGLKGVEAHVPPSSEPYVRIAATFFGPIRITHIKTGSDTEVKIAAMVNCNLTIALDVQTGILVEDPSQGGHLAIKPVNLTANVSLELQKCQAKFKMLGPCDIMGFEYVCEQVYPLLEKRIANETQLIANEEIKKQDLNFHVEQALNQVIYIELKDKIIRVGCNMAGGCNGKNVKEFISDLDHYLHLTIAYFALVGLCALCCCCLCFVKCICFICAMCRGKIDTDGLVDAPKNVLKNARAGVPLPNMVGQKQI